VSSPDTSPRSDRHPDNRLDSRLDKPDTAMSLYHLLDPEVLANPYPLFRRMRSEDPVHWDPFLHAWVVTRYADVLEVLLNFSADRTPTPAQLDEMGLSSLNPIARVMVKQMLFMDAPAHTRLRGLSSKAFTPARVEQLRGHLQDITKSLLDGLQPGGFSEDAAIDVIAQLAEPLPAIVTAEMLGVPTSDHAQLKKWSADFAEMLGNFQHNPERYPRVLQAVAGMTEYFQDAIRQQREHPREHPQEGLIHSLLTAEIDGDRLTEEEVIANCIVTMVGGQETTTNLIGNGVLTLLRNPGEMERLRNDFSLIPSAVEEMLRYESPSQHTARMCPSEREMGGKKIQKRQAVIAVMAAANRDPERFPDPDRFDITRKDNRHLAFGYAAHFCFGAPLARVEGQVVLEAFLRRFPKVELMPEPLEWRSNLGLRGLKALKVKVGATGSGERSGGQGQQKSDSKPAAQSAPSSGCPYEVRGTHDKSVQDMAGDDMAGDKQALIRKYLQARMSHKVEGAAVIPRRQESGAPLSFAPLSFAQEQIWLHCQFAQDLYNESVTVYRRGTLDVATLRRSLAEIIRRHEAWRTTFKVIEERPVQVVCPPYEPVVEVIDLRPIAADQREAEALRLGRERARVPFDMERGPLLRAMLVQLGQEEFRLYLFLHHIIFDGFSMYNVFLPELVTVYKSLLAGQASPLGELRLQYSDFAQWQRTSLDEAQLKESRAYWSSQLDGEIPVLELPTDRPRPALQSFRGAMHRFAFPKSLSDGLHQLANHEHTSFFTTILACFAALLRRYSGHEDFVLGTVTSGRKQTELEALLGCFQNPLALRLRLPGDPSFRELLTHTREVTLSALSHDNAPFERLVEELSVRRDTSRNPVFPVMFSLVPPTPAFEPGWDLNQLDLEIGTAKFDLDLELDDRPAGLQGRFVYCTDLFADATIARMVGHFQTMLEAIVANPEQKISRLPMLSGAEQRQFAEWNRTETEYPRELCMHELVETQAFRTPNANAVEHGGQSLTYRELNQRANQLAHFLAKRGIGPESKVGICLRRSLELPVALLAVLKSGAACVPLDPAYPKERLTYMLEDSGTALVLTQAGLLAEVTDFDAEVINLDADWAMFADESRENVRSGVKPENLAYLIYTSGSTGKPRGVLLTHGGLVNHNVAASQLFGLASADRMAQFASISFDIAVEEIFPTWIAGGALVVREEDASLAVGDFLHWVREKRVTALDLPTAYWHELVRELSESALRLPESLRIVIVGGEKASSAALAAWRKLAGPRVRWVNTYGPTETSVIVTSYEPKTSEDIPAVLPIGRPIANTRIYILGKNLQPLPVGIAGDLYVSGPGLARGYLNRPEITAEKFVTDPFRTEPGARMYKTGDLARYLASGEIEFAGRTDDQVKIRGYRVELEEIEAVLGSHSGAREVVIAARENAAGEKNLVAYVVPAREQVPTASALRLHLKQQLPHYMVPSAFVLLEAMPKTPNGKVDKRALPAPKSTDFAETQEYVAPSDELETQLTAIWETVLDKKLIGIRDNFFELGGHSLLAARLMHRIEQQMGQRLPLAALLQAPTVEQLSGLLRKEKWSSSWSSLVPIQAEGSRPPFFVVHGVGGNVVGFRDLARHLGPDQPFYALQPQGLDGKRECLTSIPVMAERYIQEIRRVQPEGPYRIGGYSFGGLVAYEMAQRLEAQGVEVALLALFDTYPGKVASRGSQLKNLLGLPLKQQVSFLVKKGTFVMMTLRKRLELRMLPRALRNVRQACEKAAGDYDVEPYPGRVTLFRVKEKSVGSLNDPYAIWWRVAAGGVDLREISGDHLSLLKEPQVRLLGQELSDCLARAGNDDSLTVSAQPTGSAVQLSA
jgi:amino acid adenylation domain-containing protein